MTCFDFASGKKSDELPADVIRGEEPERVPESSSPVMDTAGLFVVCRSSEIPAMRGVFGFDESTVLECIDFEERVRYASFEGYDFISALIPNNKNFLADEMNIYVAAEWLVLVIPDEPSEAAEHITAALDKFADAQLARNEPDSLNRLYYMFWQGLLAQYSDLLRQLEDCAESLSDNITNGENADPFSSIDKMRRQSHTAKKQLRELSYIGTQLVTDSNGLLNSRHARLFVGVERRIRRLYDFAESLYAFSRELLTITESRISMRTNETMNKLTLITLFFAPLTVITGIYGMNFRYMPELNWKVGYPVAIGIMLLVCVALWVIAKRKKWM